MLIRWTGLKLVNLRIIKVVIKVSNTRVFTFLGRNVVVGVAPASAICELSTRPGVPIVEPSCHVVPADASVGLHRTGPQKSITCSAAIVMRYGRLVVLVIVW